MRLNLLDVSLHFIQLRISSITVGQWLGGFGGLSRMWDVQSRGDSRFFFSSSLGICISNYHTVFSHACLLRHCKITQVEFPWHPLYREFPYLVRSVSVSSILEFDLDSPCSHTRTVIHHIVKHITFSLLNDTLKDWLNSIYPTQVRFAVYIGKEFQWPGKNCNNLNLIFYIFI